MSTQKQLSGPLKKAAMAVAVLFILLIWQAAAWSLPDFLMPDVQDVIARLWADIQSGDFRRALTGSLTRLGFGYGFALLFGIGFGLLGALLYFFREVLKNAIIILQSIPSIAWVPLFLIMMGFGNMPIIVVIALAAFFPAALSCECDRKRVGGACVGRPRYGCQSLGHGAPGVFAGSHA